MTRCVHNAGVFQEVKGQTNARKMTFDNKSRQQTGKDTAVDDGARTKRKHKQITSCSFSSFSPLPESSPVFMYVAQGHSSCSSIQSGCSM